MTEDDLAARAKCLRTLKYVADWSRKAPAGILVAANHYPQIPQVDVLVGCTAGVTATGVNFSPDSRPEAYACLDYLAEMVTAEAKARYMAHDVVLDDGPAMTLGMKVKLSEAFGAFRDGLERVRKGGGG